jgi:Holliday junction DNA helicase RuvB
MKLHKPLRFQDDNTVLTIAPSAPKPTAPQPVGADERSRNPMRPAKLARMIGQERLRSYLSRVVDASLAARRPLDHMLLAGPSGVGKSTVAQVVANELGVDCYQVEAPVSHDTLMVLRETMKDGDVLFIDEVHQQAVMERRGRGASTQPEVLFNVMEDRTIVAGTGVLPFPAITIIAATTDEGRLPDPFLNRFPLRPHFEDYTPVDLAVMAVENGAAIGHTVTTDAALRFAHASRGIPRIVNNYVKNGAALTTGEIDEATALEVLEMNGVTLDGLTAQMTGILTYLYENCATHTKDGVVYQGSVRSIARAIGRGDDVKGVYRDESFLLQRGLLQVGTRGRILSDAGVKRASLLTGVGGTT